MKKSAIEILSLFARRDGKITDFSFQGSKSLKNTTDYCIALSLELLPLFISLFLNVLSLNTIFQSPSFKGYRQILLLDSRQPRVFSKDVKKDIVKTCATRADERVDIDPGFCKESQHFIAIGPQFALLIIAPSLTIFEILYAPEILQNC